MSEMCVYRYRRGPHSHSKEHYTVRCVAESTDSAVTATWMYADRVVTAHVSMNVIQTWLNTGVWAKDGTLEEGL